MISLFILVPLTSVILLNLFKGSLINKIACWFGMLLTLVQIYLIVFPVTCFWDNLSNPLGNYFILNLSADTLSKVMLLMIGIVTFISLMIGQYTYHEETQKFNFANLIILALSGMNGIVLVTDIFSLYVFIEVVAVASFILICLYKDKAGFESAFKYIILSIAATVFMLLSIVLLFLISGDTTFTAINIASKNPTYGFILVVAIGLFTCGAFTKGGLVPFHSWLPDAHSSAPTSISILLSGIVIKVSGLYPLIRLLTMTGGGNESIKNILLIVGTVSILVGALAALGQNDIKRMLAFSSVSQMGYIVLSLGTGTMLGLVGAVFHMFNHSVFKSQLFANSAAVEKQTGTRDMNKLGGIAQKMPFTGTTSIIGMLSICGIPPLAGFWSKLIIVIALWQTAHYGYAFVAVIASVITLAYFLSLQRRVFFGKIASGLENIKEAKAGLIIPVVILAAVTILVGIFFPFIMEKLIMPVGDILK
ncbi:MAG: hypothetical protein A2474_05950 [Elusimicrobia bacterium RIFOXYC2_FULL_34_12]|nr:MAG: hypothetical protein A2474_05950 [Elusimicrobia bacterium RIFOXYC2_FULL_34_12]HAM38974.1 NADH-quinone oxidoreductase subunit L [Elusimicrobiota bacterium]